MGATKSILKIRYSSKLFIEMIAVSGLILAGLFYFRTRAGESLFSIPPENVSSVIINESPFVLPPGFKMSVFAKINGGPREMTADPFGNILASIPSTGKIIAMPDSHDELAHVVVTVAEGLDEPNGLTVRCAPNCLLYVAEHNQISVLDYDPRSMKASGKRKLIDLPSGGENSVNALMFLPAPNDNKFLISVGSSCSACKESDWRRAKILIANSDGSDLQIFASGLRDVEFMALNPKTSEVWATDINRQNPGNPIPDEINIIQEGKDYGWPNCYGKNIPDLGYDKNASCFGSVPDVIDIPPQSSPWGIAFFSGPGWPEKYAGSFAVAYHGTISGSYKIERMSIDEMGNIHQEDLISGWQNMDGSIIGRPAGLLIKDGALFISDDTGGAIYRVVYMPGY